VTSGKGVTMDGLLLFHINERRYFRFCGPARRGTDEPEDGAADDNRDCDTDQGEAEPRKVRHRRPPG
jgi:hypothetical protein